MAVAALALACAVSAVGQQPGALHPHEGQWSLEFSASTPPGGVSRVGSQGITPEHVYRVNLLMDVSRPSFTIPADGAVRWEQQGGGRVRWDDFSVQAGRSNTSDCQTVVRAAGQAIATPAPPGSGRTYDRRLTLDLSWAGGNGSGTDHAGKPFTVSLSADGNQVITSYGAAAVVYERSRWELETASVQREEISPDTIRETTIFRGSRQSATSTYKFGIPLAPITVTERIEIKHIHYPRLVPRG